MIILASRYGRLCNRLFLLAHIIAVARDNDHFLLDFSLGEYLQYFDAPPVASRIYFIGNLSNSWLSSFISVFFFTLAFYFTRTFLLLQKLAPFLKYFIEVIPPSPEDYFRIDSRFWKRKFSRKCKIFIFHEWTTRAPIDLKNHFNEVLSILKPKSSYLLNVNQQVAKLRHNSDYLIGIVIRREDYISYLNGRYYFSLENYRTIADNLLRLLPSSNVKFFFCSVTSENLDAFAGLEYFYRYAAPIENLYLLSNCDLLVSPPSTYAMWASLVGRVPLYLVHTPSADFSLDNFRIISPDLDNESILCH
jgi:hypothetical protein